jgi:tetratricopeptide (TPR) repeat protein
VGLVAFVASLASTAGMVSPADAKPKKRDAKAAFDRGLAAYKKNDFPGASTALGKSFELEPDVDTLFAWAQAERKLEHCDKANELYEKLLSYPLPAENRAAVEQKRNECNQIIAAQAPPLVDVATVAPPPQPTVAPAAPPPPRAVATRSWYKDPIPVGLIGVGIVGLGAGAGLLISARGLDNDAPQEPTYSKFSSDSHRAKVRGNLGLAIGGAGAVMVIGGVAWIVLRPHAESPPPVTGWLGPRGGGMAYSGAF